MLYINVKMENYNMNKNRKISTMDEIVVNTFGQTNCLVDKLDLDSSCLHH